MDTKRVAEGDQAVPARAVAEDLGADVGNHSPCGSPGGQLEHAERKTAPPT